MTERLTREADLAKRLSAVVRAARARRRHAEGAIHRSGVAGFWERRMAALKSGKLDRLRTKLSDEDWDAFVGAEIRDAVREFYYSEDIPANPFAPTVAGRLGEVVQAVGDHRRAAALGVTDVADAVPELRERYAPGAVQRVILAEVERLQHVADDPEMLAEQVSDMRSRTRSDGRGGLVVQHRASGLRAFFLTDTDGAFGVVHSKPWDIVCIDDGRVDPIGDWWEEISGLGIGLRIYEHGAGLLPDVRWRVNTQTREARALRRKLHIREPWRWQSLDCTCSDDWRDAAEPTDLPSHRSRS